jgi:hypothetical protein
MRLAWFCQIAVARAENACPFNLSAGLDGRLSPHGSTASSAADPAAGRCEVVSDLAESGRSSANEAC